MKKLMHAMIIIADAIIREFCTISLRTIHLIINPIIGGIPLIDIIRITIPIFLFSAVWIVFIFEFIANMKNIPNMIEYTVKYMMDVHLFKLIDDIIHPVWVIEDRTIIVFIVEVFIWLKVPKIIDNKQIIFIVWLTLLFIIIIMGITFWIVNIMNIDLIFNKFLIFNNHLWVGTIAIFVASLIITIVEIHVEFTLNIIVFWWLVINPINIVIEAIDWIKKYFISLSLDFLFLLFINVTIAIDLISIIIHIIIQDLFDIAIIGEISIVKIGVVINKKIYSIDGLWVH